MKQNTFVFNVAWRDALADYDPEVRLEVYEAAIAYANGEEIGQLRPLAKMAFSFIQRELDYYRSQYQEKRERMSSAARGRWAERRAAADSPDSEQKSNAESEQSEAPQSEAECGPKSSAVRERSEASQSEAEREQRSRAVRERSEASEIPTQQQVTDYFLLQHFSSSPERFFNHYSATGWFVGSSRIKDWHALARNWEQREKKYQQSETQKNETRNSDHGRGVSDEDFQAHIIQKLSGQ